MFEELIARESEARKRAAAILSNKVTAGAQVQSSVLESVMRTVIKDRLVPHDEMEFKAVEVGGSIALRMTHLKDGQVFSIHRHALGQLVSVAGITGTYKNRLMGVVSKPPIRERTQWSMDLLCTNLNTIYTLGEFLDRRKQPARYLHRAVEGELRGFLSRSHNRKLNNANLLRPFVEACSRLAANPVSAASSSTRVMLKYMLPYVFEPVDGEFVAFGASYSNSDFGAGRMRISGTCLRITSDTLSVMEDGLSKVHLGPMIEESDIELSDETADKEVAAYQSAVCDTVKAVLAPDSVNRAIRAIQVAHEHEIPWYKLSRSLAAVLQKSEIEDIRKLLDGEGTVDLPPVPTPGNATAWWVSTVVGTLANKEVDEERRADMQVLAGSFLEVK